MSRHHNHALYEGHEAIPDVVPPRLILPHGSRVRLVQAAEHTTTTTTPVEVGFAFYKLGAGGFAAEHQLLELYEDEEFGLEIPHNFLENDWGNHLGRIMLKAMLDPDRLSPLDLVDAYRRESRFRGFNEDEEKFFADFTKNWGVLNRELQT